MFLSSLRVEKLAAFLRRERIMAELFTFVQMKMSKREKFLVAHFAARNETSAGKFDAELARCRFNRRPAPDLRSIHLCAAHD